MKKDSTEYRQKKDFYDNLLTIYGRKPVLEALEDPTINIFRIHMADSNKKGGIISEILQLAETRNIELQWHDKKALSRISRNSKQDQGIAADLELSQYQSVDQFLKLNTKKDYKLIALDSITNPQNVGMIIRSACAGYVDGIILPRKGCAALSPLVIKASVGTVFKATILYCDQLAPALKNLKDNGAEIYTLSSHAKSSLFNQQENNRAKIFVLGNETEGVSKEITKLSDNSLSIPMNNEVESLNVAITAALIAFNS